MDLCAAIIGDSLPGAGIDDGHLSHHPEVERALARTGSGLGERVPGGRAGAPRLEPGHPNEFALLFGTPIRGYAAPEGGVTVAAVRRMSVGLLRPLTEADLQASCASRADSHSRP